MILVVQMYNIFRLSGGKNVNNKMKSRMILVHVQKKMLDPNLGRTCRIEALGNI